MNIVLNSNQLENSMDDEVMKFLQKHENKSGKVGEFVRSCILVATLAEWHSRKDLKESAQMGYLLDCFLTLDEEDEEDHVTTYK